jgi:glycosyltransferase involved in cell wall biosynthesis
MRKRVAGRRKIESLSCEERYLKGRAVNKDSPLFSVIINVHNGEAFLQDAINSAIGQSHKNFELLIWDNYSDDRTPAIAQRASLSDGRVRVIRSEVKTSLYEARNLALKSTKGELVAFLDSDDLWLNDKLSISASALANKDVGVFYSNFEIWDFNKDTKRIAYKAKLPEGYLLEHLVCNYTVALSTIVFRKTVLDTFEGPFNGKYSIIGDYDLVLRMATEHKFASSNLPLTVYRVHGQNLSTLAVKERKSEIAAWSANASLKQFLNKRLFRRARVSLLLDATLAENKRPHVKFFRLLGMLLGRGLIVVVPSKLRWRAANVWKS